MRQADYARDAQALQICRDERTGLEVVPKPDDHGSEGSDIDLLQRIFNGRVQGDCRGNVVGDCLHPGHVAVYAEDGVAHSFEPPRQAGAKGSQTDYGEFSLGLSLGETL